MQCFLGENVLPWNWELTCVVSVLATLFTMETLDFCFQYLRLTPAHEALLLLVSGCSTELVSFIRILFSNPELNQKYFTQNYMDFFSVYFWKGFAVNKMSLCVSSGDAFCVCVCGGIYSSSKNKTKQKKTKVILLDLLVDIIALNWYWY